MTHEELKEYWRQYSREYRKKNPEWKKLDNKRNRELILKMVTEYHKKYPEKRDAKQILIRAVYVGKVKRGKCVFQGEHSEMIDGHHPDYSKPLEVIWMCHSHHKKFHYNLIQLPNIIKVKKSLKKKLKK